MKTKLSSRNLLLELENPEYESLLDEFSISSFSKNMLIYAPDHSEDSVFIVKHGKVRIYLAYEDKEFSLAILEKGDIYSTHTRAYVSALEDTELMIMPTAKFHQFMIIYPFFSKTIVSILGELLKQTFSIVDSLVFKDVPQRIVEFLLYEARHHGHKKEKGIEIEVDLTVEQLAAVVGSTRQTASTILNQMLKAGVLYKSGRKKYLIPNLNNLKEFTNNREFDQNS